MKMRNAKTTNSDYNDKKTRRRISRWSLHLWKNVKLTYLQVGDKSQEIDQ